MDSIPDAADQRKVTEQLTQDSKEVIALSLDQMKHFAGNMLLVKNKNGKSLLVMSEQAYLSLNEKIRCKHWNDIVNCYMHLYIPPKKM